MKDTPYDEYKGALLKYKLATPEMIDQLSLPLDQYGPAKNVSAEDVEKVLQWMTDKKMIANTHTYESLVAKGVFKQ